MSVVEEDWTYPENKTVEDLQGKWSGGKFKQGPLRAGVVMEVRTRKGKETVLIGDVNELLGVCDDCKDTVVRDTPVIRYKTVWKP